MSYLVEKALQVITDDPEQLFAAMSGSITDSILHPRKLVPCVLKTVVVGFFLAEFVSPAVAERLELTQKEAVALSFVCGYAGVRILKVGEDVLISRVQPKGGASEMSTPSANSGDTSASSD